MKTMRWREDQEKLHRRRGSASLVQPVGSIEALEQQNEALLYKEEKEARGSLIRQLHLSHLSVLVAAVPCLPCLPR